MRRRKQEMSHNVRTGAAMMTRWWRRLGILCLQSCLFWAATAMVSPAQDQQPSTDSVTFTNLFNFDGTNGGNPVGPLVQGTDGDLYGTTANAGSGCAPYGCGTFFRISPSGTLTTLYNFCPEGIPCQEEGGDPVTGLTLGTDGNFYGSMSYGGANGGGTVFRITPGGVLTTLYNWCSQPNCADGEDPGNALTQGVDGNFYGTIAYGGTGSAGTAFRITPGGALTTLYSFCSQPNCTDGANPSAGLALGADANLYGTTSQGGVGGLGTVFKITPAGVLTTLYSFCPSGVGSGVCPDGDLPGSPLIQATDGNFYGTTTMGGGSAACPYGRACGTVFKITPEGALTTIYNFCSQTNCTDGGGPVGALVQAHGNFYGTTYVFGSTACSYGCGTVFELTPEGVLTTLHSFDMTDGAAPEHLAQATDGNLYGATFSGGIANSSLCFGYSGTCGTLFEVAVGLGPFVETVPTSGKAGSVVKILGYGLSGATAVSFNGVAAVFKVVSKTLISATVPSGATTGFVTVTTPSGTLKSNVKFQVRP